LVTSLQTSLLHHTSCTAAVQSSPLAKSRSGRCHWATDSLCRNCRSDPIK
jgi:hypothetical protein